MWKRRQRTCVISRCKRFKTLAAQWSLYLALSLIGPGAWASDFATCVAELRIGIEQQIPPTPATRQLIDNLTEIPRVIAEDRSQAEFTRTFRDYYLRRVTSKRIDTGRTMRHTHAPLLQRIERIYGVQGPYLLALWGLETNFGSYLGKLSVPSALATLACEGRRRDFFTAQLTALVDLVAKGDMREDQLIGSWAGAMGHMQFMPTTYSAYAIDGDGDGRRDVYASLPDALSSAAHYLQQLDWQPGYRWGREVMLPPGFDYAEAHYGNWQTLSYWRDQGVTDSAGRLVAELDLSSAILLPSGKQGPAFIVYPNFKAIMKWNRSINYALSVGRLADRIAGMGGLATPLPSAAALRLSTEDLIEIQQHLIESGDLRGKADGILGLGTRGALRAYQKRHALDADGYPTTQLLQHLRAREDTAR